MEPFPTSIHIGPLHLHLYGLGVGIAAYVAFRYCQRRLEKRSLPSAPAGNFAMWVVGFGLVGARVAHVATHWDFYNSHPAEILAVWNGGLASFGGLALAIPVGLYLLKRTWPGVAPLVLADTIVVAVVAGWALGRLLGPQFMLAGGGHLTHQWFGLRYAGQFGRRVPVPLIQAIEDGLLWLFLIFLEQRSSRRPGQITAFAMVVWGLVRAADERLLLGQDSASGSRGVQMAGVFLALSGIALLAHSRNAGKSKGRLA
ncbi:MAG: prolipoprotein diacylglyceryl transferase family protein [Actinomycetota bacterium]